MKQKVLKKPKGDIKPLDDDKLDQEIQWRSWFPRGIEWKPVDVNPPEVVEPLLEAFSLFCENNIKVKHPAHGHVPLVLRDAQLETVRGWLTNRYTIVLKARQIGFSTIASAFALWVALHGNDREIIMLSIGEREAISLLNKARYAYRKLPEWVRKRAPRLMDRTKERMTFDNDSKIMSYPSTSDPARGESVFLMIVDEWGKFPNGEEAWSSIEPVTDAGGRVISLGTANGEGNFFHRMWQGAERGTNDFVPMFFSWRSVPERDDKWYAQKKRNMEPWQLHQEYPSNPGEAFIGSGNPFFDLSLLADMEPQAPEGRYTINSIDKRTSRWRLHPAAEGEFWVWKKPDKRLGYCVGADIAQGLKHGDWTVAYVMEVGTGDVVAMWRGKVDPEIFGTDILPAIGFYYNYALMCPEVNNHGLTVVNGLKRRRYQRIYRRRTKLKRVESATETIGWMTSHGNKHSMMDELSAWLRDHDVLDERTLYELKTFVRSQRGERVKLHGSPHDDCVMALALTVQAKKYAIENNVVEPEATNVPGSIDWWDRKLSDAGTQRPRMSAVV